jgi:acyl-CoA dehydrogenase
LISFELNDDQVAIRDVIASFANERLRPAARAADETGEIDSTLVDAAQQLRLTAGWIPEEFGGDGTPPSAVTGALIVEELAWGDLAQAIYVIAPRLVAFPLIEWGGNALQSEMLPRFAAVSFVPGSLAVTEPRYDFDLLTLKTVARREGNDWVLTGMKSMVPLAAESEEILVCASLEAQAGLSNTALFLVNRNAPGLKVLGREKNMGLKALPTYSLALENCRVDDQRMLGGPSILDFPRLAAKTRVAATAMATGVARAAFEYSRDYAKERKTFGAPIATRQSIAFMIADMAIEVEAMRLLAWEAAWRLDRGESAFIEATLARNYAADAVLKVTDNAVQILGGHGYIRDHPVELWLRNGRGFAAFEGFAIV